MSASTDRGLDLSELRHQSIETLPDRTAMSLVNANLALPINLGLAANVLSDGSIAAAGATQNRRSTRGCSAARRPSDPSANDTRRYRR